MATAKPPIQDLRVHQQVEGDNNIVVGVGNVTVTAYQFQESESDHRSLRVLLDRVERFWITGVLKDSLHGEALMSIGMEPLSDAIEHPWERVLEVPGQAVRPLPPEQAIEEIFEDLSGFLLILGEPGAGKTTTLLELASRLIHRARSDPREPVPIVLNLSTWTDGRKSLTAWIVDELKSKYFVSRKTALTCLRDNRIVLLLDGLDEIESGNRCSCVKAINDFVQEVGPPGLVVSSRATEYRALQVRLRLNGAVLLLPLTTDQVAGYLRLAGPRLEPLAAALQCDPDWRDLAQSPLMLSIMILAYQDAPLAALSEGRRDSANVFSTYVERMFERRGRRNPPYAKEDSICWLINLAQEMRRRSQTIFLIEQLQPTWLNTRRQCWLYSVGSRLLAGVAILISLYIIFPPISEVGSLGLGAGLVDGFRFEMQSRRKEPRRAGYLWWVFVHIAMACLLAYVTLLARPRVAELSWYVVGLFCLAYSPVGLFFALRARHRADQDIRPVETLTWSWTAAKRTSRSGLLGGAAVGVAFAIDVLSNQIALDCIGILMSVLVLASFFAVAGALAMGIYGGIVGRSIEAKTRPNQGIILSVRNCLFAGCGVGAIVFLVVFLLFVLRDIKWLPTALTLAWVSGFIGALWFGGTDLLNHFMLRIILWHSGRAPYSYPRFLDYATRLVFLHKVGGGYIFRHRLLLEYFADLSGSGKPVSSAERINL